MAKNHYHRDHHKIILVLVVAIVAFVFGFILARAKYKSQLEQTFNMVMSQQSQIAGDNTQIKELKNAVNSPTPSY